MCDICGKEWIPFESNYPCGPCPKEWICPDCKAVVSPCCGALLIYKECEVECETCDYCGSATCTKCEEHTHCGGCV